MKKCLPIAALLLAIVMIFSACAGAQTSGKSDTPTSGSISVSAGESENMHSDNEKTAADASESGASSETPKPTEPTGGSGASSETQSPTEPTGESDATGTETPTETPMPKTPLSPEDEADLAFLSSLDGLKYQLGAQSEGYFFGRWFEKEIEGAPHHVTLTDGAQVFLLCEGCESLDFVFTVITSLDTPYFAVSIDGAKPKRRRITEPTVALPDTGRHVVRMVVDSMCEAEAKWKDEIGVALREIVPSEGGHFRAIKPKNKVIFFYGDSITEGTAVFGSNSPKDNSASSAYPWIVCDRLNAVPYHVGYSGSGVQVVGSFAVFSEAVNHFSKTREADMTVTPDLIVVNHGTNDGDAETSGFRGSLKTALGKIEKAYPGVPIVYMLPFCGNRASDIRTVCAEFDNITVVETDKWNISYSDGLHPNRNGAKRAGELLSREINALLGADFFKV